MRLLSYSLVGAVATLVHYGILIFLSEVIHLLPAYATALGAVVGALIAYSANSRFTFNSRREWVSALPRFLLVALVGACINSVIVWFGNSLLGVNYLVPQLIATLLVMLLTFELNRTWTFSV